MFCSNTSGDFLSIITQVKEEGEIKMSIRRKTILEAVQHYIKSPEFSFLKTPCVTFFGENAVDQGGPKREFFRLINASEKLSILFCGGNKLKFCLYVIGFL